MKDYSFEKLAAKSAFLNGIAAFLYAYAFIILSRTDADTGAFLSAFFLLVQGLLLTAVYVAVYHHVSARHPSAAMWMLLMGVMGALGMAVHGGYDLANAVNPPIENLLGLANLPSQADPRGLMTFGVGGIALLGLSYLLSQNKAFPKGLAYLGFISAILSLVLYLGRLTILTPAHPVILWSAIANGFLIGPSFYVYLGSVLWKGKN